jgi:hypothetical protein
VAASEIPASHFLAASLFLAALMALASFSEITNPELAEFPDLASSYFGPKIAVFCILDEDFFGFA